jgi:hypothetical protein
MSLIKILITMASVDLVPMGKTNSIHLDRSRTKNSLMATDNQAQTMKKTRTSWLQTSLVSSATRIKTDSGIPNTRPRGFSRGSQAGIWEKMSAKHGKRRIMQILNYQSLERVWRCLHPDQSTREPVLHTENHSCTIKTLCPNTRRQGWKIIWPRCQASSSMRAIWCISRSSKPTMRNTDSMPAAKQNHIIRVA